VRWTSGEIDNSRDKTTRERRHQSRESVIKRERHRLIQCDSEPNINRNKTGIERARRLLILRDSKTNITRHRQTSRERDRQTSRERHVCGYCETYTVKRTKSRIKEYVCSKSQCHAVSCSVVQCHAVSCVSACCSVSQRVAVCRSALQCVAVCRSVTVHTRQRDIFRYNETYPPKKLHGNGYCQAHHESNAEIYCLSSRPRTIAENNP